MRGRPRSSPAAQSSSRRTSGSTRRRRGERAERRCSLGLEVASGDRIEIVASGGRERGGSGAVADGGRGLGEESGAPRPGPAARRAPRAGSSDDPNVLAGVRVARHRRWHVVQVRHRLSGVEDANDPSSSVKHSTRRSSRQRRSSTRFRRGSGGRARGESGDLRGHREMLDDPDLLQMPATPCRAAKRGVRLADGFMRHADRLGV